MRLALLRLARHRRAARLPVSCLPGEIIGGRRAAVTAAAGRDPDRGDGRPPPAPPPRPASLLAGPSPATLACRAAPPASAPPTPPPSHDAASAHGLHADDDGAAHPILDESERASLLRYAALSPTPLELRTMIFDEDAAGGDDSDLWRAASFLAEEFPVRCAERTLMIESLPGWEGSEELREAHGAHCRAFAAVRRCAGRLPRWDEGDDDGDGRAAGWVNGAGGEGLAELESAVRTIVEWGRDIVPLMSRAMHRLSRIDPEFYREEFVNDFLDQFLLNRVGTQVMLRQYLARAALSSSSSSDPFSSPSSPSSLTRSGYIIDPRCDVGAVCRLAARDVVDICRRETGLRPTVKVEVHSSSSVAEGRKKEGGSGFGDILQFTYMPDALAYVLRELIKNSCRATTDIAAGGSPSELVRRPIQVVACGDERRVIISVSDRAGGIPFEVGKRAFSYLYTTTRSGGRGSGSGGGDGGVNDGKRTDAATNGGTELAGFGVGLPLSRLYTRYLGGDLNLVSLPGYGTNAYIFLPRLESNQVEVVPDKDYEWSVGRLKGEFVL